MQLDFQFDGIRYILNFDDPILENSIFAFELRVYYSLDPNSSYSSSLKRIENNRIVWGSFDNAYLPKEAQEYCDRYIKNKAFL